MGFGFSPEGLGSSGDRAGSSLMMMSALRLPGVVQPSVPWLRAMQDESITDRTSGAEKLKEPPLETAQAVLR